MYQSAAASELVPAARAARWNATRLGTAVGVWIGLYPFADLAVRPKIGVFGGAGYMAGQTSPVLAMAQLAILLLGIFPILAGVVILGVDFRRAKFFAASIFLFALSIPLSYLSMSDLSCFNFVVLIDYTIACAILLVSTNVDREPLIRALLSAVALTLGVAMVAVLIDQDVVWGRLMGRTAPDYWGHLALSTILATLAMRGRVVRILLIALSLTVMASTQSRSDIVSLAAGLSVAAVLFTRHPRVHRWVWIWFAAALGLVAAFGLGMNFISNDLFRLSDPFRGAGTGFTGRSDLWRETWEIFASHPWLGVGYGQHAFHLSTLIAGHNAYLAALADTGIVGFLGYMIFFLGALCRSLLQAWKEPTGDRIAIAAFLSAFAVIGLVEPTGFHTGNSFSMLTIFVAAWVWRTDHAGPAWIFAPDRQMRGVAVAAGSR